MRILVLGAGGLIGTHVRRALRADPAGHETICLGRARRDPQTAERWIIFDLATGDRGELARVMREARPEAVINCSGETAGDLPELVGANVLIVARVIEAIEAAGIGGRLVQLGSAAEYGAVPSGTAISEEAPTRPVSPYGVTKLAGSLLVAQASAAGRLDGLVLRIFNPVGAGLPESSLPGRAAARIRRALASGNREIRLGSLAAYRDFVDVRDVATAVVAAATTPSVPSPILNVGSGRAIRVREVVELLAAIAGFDGVIAEGVDGSPRSGEVPWQAADLARIGRELGWVPRFDLRSSAEALWQGVR
ncbi:MAG: hypothetical protein A2X23_07900 [Chloroflexi bacterium GWC2_73_18]|nr:MAG: hypothetical protein A2X23_07900 [Chloroflexi bacterium GWC2_73_18]